MQILIPFPLPDGIGTVLKMSLAVRVVGYEIVRLQRTVQAASFDAAFKRIGPAGRGPVGVNGTALFIQKGTRVGLLLE